jgi:RNA polymerase sigma-70 factor (ECF subfamily)
MATDEECFRRFLDGDEEGFNDLLDKYRVPLFSFIRRMVGNAEADDIFQETFMRVLRHRRQFNPARRFSPWLFAIAANLCRDALRRRRRSLEQPTAVLPELAGHSNPETDSAGAEIGTAIERAVSGLSPEQREVFLLREQAGLSFREIAKATGANLNTVLGRMRLAVKKIKAELEPIREK